MVQTCLWFCATLGVTSLVVAQHEAAEPSVVSSGLLLLSPLLSTSTSKFQTTARATHLDTKIAATHVAVQRTATTSVSATGTTQINETMDKSLAAAEPDVSLQIVFYILGTLLASASVVVAIFFGCRQPRGNPGQPGIAHHETPHGVLNSGSSDDLEMGPVAVPCIPAPPGAQSHVADQIITHTLGDGFANFFDKLKSMWAATSYSLRRGGQSSASPPNLILAPVRQNPAAPMENSHEQQGGDATRSTATSCV
jgi:hypothetical protein